MKRSCHRGSVADAQRQMLVLCPYIYEGFLDVVADAAERGDAFHGQTPTIIRFV
jgi:hypothetical protein